MQNRKVISQAELDAYVKLLKWLLIEKVRKTDGEDEAPKVPAIAAGPEVRVEEASRKLDEVFPLAPSHAKK